MSAEDHVIDGAACSYFIESTCQDPDKWADPVTGKPCCRHAVGAVLVEALPIGRTLAEAALRKKLTQDFLSALVEAVRLCGWSVDLYESSAFVTWCHDLAGAETPDLSAKEF